MLFLIIYIIMILGDKMNNFEIIRVLNRMVDNTREISLDLKLYYLLEGLTIDKNMH